MSSEMLEELQCPICMETLRTPVRMLTCGHNLCHVCLVQLCESYVDKRCPTCRKIIELGSNGVNDIPRNHTLEHVIDGFTKLGISEEESFGEASHSETSLEHLKRKALICQHEKKFAEAIEILQEILTKLKGEEKLPFSLKQAICCFELGRLEKAKNLCFEIVTVMDSYTFSVTKLETQEECDIEMTQLAQKFLNVKDYNNTILMVRCIFKFVANFYNGLAKLNKLQRIGKFMESLAQEMSKQNKKDVFKLLYSFMENILKDMQLTDNVDLKLKCKTIAWFLKCFALCCFEVKDFFKAIMLNNNAITLIKSVYGSQADKCIVLALCYHNLGAALESTNHLDEANAAYNNAIDVKHLTNEWISDAQKTSSVSVSVRAVSRIATKISKRPK